jgi:cytochrome subunit of sulfide dehydrogenase
MQFNIWFFAIHFITSVGLALTANAAEVISATETHSNSPHIRTLAASCAACHGSGGNSAGITPTLAGLEAGYFTTQMLAFKDGSRASTVMHHHAKGLHVDEINLLAVYFSQQNRSANTAPKSQTLKANHDN